LPACREASRACQPDPNRDLSPKNLWRRKEEEEKGKKEKSSPFGVNLMGSPVLYWAVQGKEEESYQNRTTWLY